jgi:phosphonate metabolism-associated iron-containing alcohol dehydrogenase
VNTWSFHNPVRVRVGVDTLNDIGTLLHGRSYAIVTYPDAPFRAMTQRIEALAGPSLACIDNVEANPSMSMLRAACAQLAALPQLPEVLVALGGGSVMDSAKVLAAEHGEFEPMLAYLTQGRESGRRALPIIAIPTTSGTGSEVTSWATVWDPDNDRKLSLSRDDLYPEAVLVDPRLVVGLPRVQTVASGLDALSHALESLWNVHANPVTRGLAVEAARRGAIWLRARSSPRCRKSPPTPRTSTRAARWRWARCVRALPFRIRAPHSRTTFRMRSRSATVCRMVSRVRSVCRP